MVDSFSSALSPASSLASQPTPESRATNGLDGAAAGRHVPAQAPPLGEPSPADASPELLLVGRLVAAQGLGGELRVLPLSDFPERFTRPGRRWLKARGKAAVAVQLRSGRQLPGRDLFVVRLEGINDRSAAEALVGQELMVPAQDRPPLAPGEFHLLDLVGLEVRLLGGERRPAGVPIASAGGAEHAGATEAGADAGAEGGGAGTAPLEGGADQVIGRVVDLIHAGNDLLEVELHGATANEPHRLVFIPFVKAIVPEVNLAEGWIGLTPPPGLLEL